jgi:hypothetical protein
VPLPYTTPFDVSVVAPVPPLATGKVPVTPVVKGKPVQEVKVPEVGVPRRGVTNVGLVANTLFPEPVFVTLTSPFDAFVATAEDSVNELRIGCAVNVAIPVTPKVVLNVPDVNAPVLAVFAPIGTPSIPELIAPEALVFVAKNERLAE